jgi:hypothetical protein
MAVPGSVDAQAFLREQLESASPDLLRSMVKTFAEALMSAEADASTAAPSTSTPWSPSGPNAVISREGRVDAALALTTRCCTQIGSQ